jgi:hypothetical protein
MTPEGYENLFYINGTYELSGSDPRHMTQIADFEDGNYYYLHYSNTARYTPNQKQTTVIGTRKFNGSWYYADKPYYNVAQDTYLEVFKGYPRNHYTHKRMQFSPMKFLSFMGNAKTQKSYIYIRGSQTIDTTIDNDSGLEDNTLPIQSIQTSNINLVQSYNVINQ